MKWPLGTLNTFLHYNHGMKCLNWLLAPVKIFQPCSPCRQNPRSLVQGEVGARWRDNGQEEAGDGRMEETREGVKNDRATESERA